MIAFYLDTQFLFAVSCSSVSSEKGKKFHHCLENNFSL